MNLTTSKPNVACRQLSLINESTPCDAGRISGCKPTGSRCRKAGSSLWLSLIAVAVSLAAVPLRADIILYDTLGVNADDANDAWAWALRSPHNLGASFLSAPSAGYLTSVTLDVNGNGSALDVYLYANTALDGPDFANGPVSTLGTLHPGPVQAFYTLNFTNEVPLAANTEYWIVGSGTSGGWMANFLSIPSFAAHTVGTANQRLELYGTAYSIYPQASNEVFEMRVTESDASTPEPSTWGMLALGVTVIVARRRTHQRMM